MSRVSWCAAVGLALAGTLFGPDVTAESSAGDSAAVLRIEVAGTGGTNVGTCVLVHREPQEGDVVYYFLTAARLFDPESVGERRAAVLRVRIVVDATRVIESSGSQAVFPGGIEYGLDLALVRVVSSTTDLVPMPISMTPPDAGQTFVVLGRQDHEVTLLAERVRFRSTRLVIGDRTASDVAGLIGAPAMVDGRVFGLVSECSTSRVPVVTLLSAASGFLSRGIPGWRPARHTDPERP